MESDDVSELTFWQKFFGQSILVRIVLFLLFVVSVIVQTLRLIGYARLAVLRPRNFLIVLFCMIITGTVRYVLIFSDSDRRATTESQAPNPQPKRRFVQLRTLEDPLIAAEVHGVALYPGGRWMGDNGVETDPDKPEKFAIECVLGEGIAETLGPDYGKKRLVTGDTFQLGEMTWKVIGVMNSEGKTYGSEIWAKRIGLIYKPFGKEKPTTLIMRTEADTKGASRKFAFELNSRYTQHKLKAYSEPDYFAELTKTNNFFLTAIIIVCVVMAIGGVFGMMTTMFATIASRIRDIGVLRLLGFKRWQVTVSFLLESLAVATVGGALGCAVAWLVADGRSSVSMLSAGGNGPGGKSVALTINVDAQVIAMGMLFTLVMGRLGGLVPALSAMRIKILDSLR